MLRRLGAIAGAALLTFGVVATVFADSGNPLTISADPPVGNTVTVSGTWNWDRCDDADPSDRYVGWAVDWGDDFTGNELPGASTTYNMGEPGTYPDTQGNHIFSPLDTGDPTNCVGDGSAGSGTGTWGPLSHTYAEPGTYDVCVVIYDIHTAFTKITKLDGAIDSSTTTITVDSSVGIQVGDRLSIENEELIVTGVPSGTQLTVTRGANGTTAAGHADNKDVKRFGAKNASELLAGGPDRNEDNSVEKNFTEEENCAGTRITIEVNPSIAIVKTADPTSLPIGGGSVTFTYTVTNTGNVPLDNVNVTDAKCTPVSFVGGDTDENDLLDLDETWTYTCTKTLTQTETNVGVASGEFGSEEPIVVTDDDDATVEVAAATPVPPTAPPTAAPSQDVLGATATPRVTLPPTDSIGGGNRAAPNFATALAGIGLVMLLTSLLASAAVRARARTRR